MNLFIEITKSSKNENIKRIKKSAYYIREKKHKNLKK